MLKAIFASLATAAAMALLWPATGRAQQAPAPASLSFAVVSVRPFSPPKNRVYAVCVRHEDPEMYSLQACTLNGLVLQALGLESNEVELVNQGPEWSRRRPTARSHRSRRALLRSARERTDARTKRRFETRRGSIDPAGDSPEGLAVCAGGKPFSAGVWERPERINRGGLSPR